jgi:predicted DNA-binding transcriptional regulator AlpA
MGALPKPVRIGGRTSRFLREELDAHDARQAAERGAQT